MTTRASLVEKLSFIVTCILSTFVATCIFFRLHLCPGHTVHGMMFSAAAEFEGPRPTILYVYGGPHVQVSGAARLAALWIKQGKT